MTNTNPSSLPSPAHADTEALFDNYLANVDSDSWRLDKGWKADEVGPFGVYHRDASEPPVSVSRTTAPMAALQLAA